MENYDEDQIQHIKGVIETVLFISGTPVTLEQIKKVLNTVEASEIKQFIQMLANDYQERKSGIVIEEIAGGYQMLSSPIYAHYAKELFKTRQKEKLSKPALESLAIIAYKQPVTRADIELVRGVNSDGVVAHLLNKELIKVAGRKDVPGKPFLYGTTKQFLEYFGLKSIKDLPRLEEFPALQAKEISSGEEIREESISQNEGKYSRDTSELEESEINAQLDNAAVNDMDESDEDVLRESISEEQKETQLLENDHEDRASSTVAKAEEFLRESEEEVNDESK
ncbi:MAG: SMC-Scp complex subunit ScpB [Candidatus Omnitrophica bacterium]|nr:SMC-Scp complex subunit ScpB [Candidatus Omnitrophota bacterium]